MRAWDDGGEDYLARMMGREVDRVVKAPKGKANETLYWSTRRLISVAAGWNAPDHWIGGIQTQMTIAGHGRGKGKGEIARTIGSAVKDGLANPTPPPARTLRMAHTPKGKAEEWLRERLAGGIADSRQVISEAAAAGISRGTIYRAKKKLGVITTPMTDQKQLTAAWSLPKPRNATGVSHTQEDTAHTETSPETEETKPKAALKPNTTSETPVSNKKHEETENSEVTTEFAGTRGTNPQNLRDYESRGGVSNPSTPLPEKPEEVSADVRARAEALIRRVQSREP